MNSRWSSVSSEKKPEYPWCLVIAGRGLVAAALLAPALSVPVPADEPAIFTQDAPRDYTILLKARQFVPPPGITEESLDRIRSSDLRRVHVIVQFFDPVTVSQQEILKKLDVLLLKNQYVPNLAFYASLPPERALSVAALPFVRAVIHIEYWYKTEARLLAGEVTDYSRRPGGEILVGVEFHEDVSSDDAAAILREHSGKIVDAPIAGRSLATIPESECVNLLNEDSIYWLLDLVEPTPLLDGLTLAIGADAVQANPRLDGTGVEIGLWDDGIPGGHPDLAGRVINGDSSPSPPFGRHATGVAGIAIGNGSVDPTYTGVATNAVIVGHTVANYFSEHDAAIDLNVHGIDLENISFAGVSTPQRVDQIVTGFWHGRRISSVWAGGNSGPDFYTLPTRGGQSAKNSITVGGTNSSDGSMWWHASRGPAPDGRVKPDIAAPACNEIGDFVTVPASPSLNIPNTITMEVRMKPTDPCPFPDPQIPGCQSPRPLLHYNAPPDSHGQAGGDHGSNGVSMMQWFSSSDFTAFAVSTTDAYDGVRAPGIFVAPPGTWYHVVATYDRAGSVGKLYLDGVEIPSPISVAGSQALLTLQTFHDLLVGACSFGLNRKYNGILDDVRVYNRVLNASDVWMRFSSPQFSVGGEVLILDFDGPPGQVVQDSSGKGNHGFLGFAKENVPGLDGNEPLRIGGLPCQFPGALATNQCLQYSVGPGDNIKGPQRNGAYSGGCGTSAASPAVAGSIALLIQYWRDLGYGPDDPWPSTVKAILLMSAEDVGHPGPDFAFGYGKLRIDRAVELLGMDNGTRKQIIERSIRQNQVHRYRFDVAGSPVSMKVQLVSDDNPAVSSVTKKLYNDLDLVLQEPVPPGPPVFHMPYILDPNAPENTATRGEDHMNNVEQVEVMNPRNGTWTAIVRGHLLPDAGSEQSYSLILPFPKN